MADSRKRFVYPGSSVETISKKALFIDEEGKKIVDALLKNLVFATFSTVPGSLSTL